MDISRANLEALFRSYSTAWQEVLGVGQPEPMDFLVSEFPSTTASNFYLWLDKVPGFRRWVGDRVYNHARGQRFEVLNEDYEDSIRLDANDIEDDQYGLYTPIVRMMARSWLELRRDLSLAVLLENRRSFTGEAFFSASHAYGSHALANLTSEALSVTTFEAAFAAAAGWRFSDGRPVKTRFTHLIVGEKLRRTAWNIVQNSRAEVGEAGAVVDNPNYQRVNLLVWPELTGDFDDYWFLVDGSKPVKPVALQVRKDPVPVMDQDAATVARQGFVDFLASGRLAAAPTFPHLAYGGLVA